jgi:SAM-dependent methyltransferase
LSGAPCCDLLFGTVRMMQDRGYEKAARFYDLFDTKDNIGFFRHYAVQVQARAPGAEILDVGAGTGRIAVPLAEGGARLVCVEPSPAMRAQLQAKLDARPDLGERISLAAGDAASFDLGRTFPAAFLSGTFDHFMDRAERLASLKNVACHLQPGGTLVFDVFLGLMRDSPPSPAGCVQVGEWEYRRFVSARVLPEHTIEVTLVYEVRQGGVLQERVKQRSMAAMTDRAEVHGVLAEAGFRVRREFCDYDFTPYQEGDALLVVEAVP